MKVLLSCCVRSSREKILIPLQLQLVSICLSTLLQLLLPLAASCCAISLVLSPHSASLGWRQSVRGEERVSSSCVLSGYKRAVLWRTFSASDLIILSSCLLSLVVVVVLCCLLALFSPYLSCTFSFTSLNIFSVSFVSLYLFTRHSVSLLQIN